MNGPCFDELSVCYADARHALAAGNLAEAERLLEKAIRLDDTVPELYNALGVLRMQQEDLAAAEIYFCRALALEPEQGDALLNLSNLLFARDCLADAIQVCQRAVAHQPHNARAWQNLGVLLQANRSFVESEACYRRALTLQPDYPTALWNLAQWLLQQGRFAEGWEAFESRFSKTDPVPLTHQHIPLWGGDEPAGATVLVHAEQGYGSTIQFVRYLPLLTDRGYRVLFECQDESILPLFASLPGVEQTFTRLSPAMRVDCHIPLMSLPRVFCTDLENLPHQVPYLTCDPALRASWQERLGEHDRLRVGLCWAGRSKPDPRRSCPLSVLTPLAGIAGIRFISLQVDRSMTHLMEGLDRFPMEDMTPLMKDFADTAALISCLDLVISVDTVVAHLAGALGVPTWTMLPYSADWRWLLNRSDSPWYPSMRLFRQEQPGGWGQIAEEIRTALLCLVQGCFAEKARSTATKLAGNLLEMANGWASAQQYPQAVTCYRKITSIETSIDPSLRSTAHHNLGVVFIEQRRFVEAEEQFVAALAVEPDSSRNHNALGIALMKQDRFAEAVHSFTHALACEPANLHAMNNLGTIYKFQGQGELAIGCFQRILAIDPSYADAEWNLSLAYLLLGNYRKGWSHYDARWTKATSPVEKRVFAGHQWDGHMVPDDTILLYAEQGFGDTLQFIRFVPEVASRCRRVVVECQTLQIRSMLQRVEGVAEVVVRGDVLGEDYQWYASLLDIAGIIDITLEKLPYRERYLVPDVDKVATRYAELRGYDGMKIGLAWAGRPEHENDRRRSCSLSQLAPLLNTPGVVFFPIQFGNAVREMEALAGNYQFVDVTSSIADFDDTAALLANLDLVITVDTSLAHLAGGMGVPTWVLIPFVPDWRWLLGRQDSPWYPVMRLFRQSEPGDWDGVARQIAGELGKVLSLKEKPCG